MFKASIMRSFVLLFVFASCIICTTAFAPSLPSINAGMRLRSSTPLKVRASAKSEEPMLNRRNAFSLLVSTSVAVALSSPVMAKPTKATAEETVESWRKLYAANELLKSTDAMVSKKDWAAIVELLGRSEFTEMEGTLLKLVNGPILNQDDKKTIGTRKRYGIAADVLYGIGGVLAAVAAISDPQLKGCSAGVCSGKFVEADVEVPKSVTSLKASVNEILNICKPYKEFTAQ